MRESVPLRADLPPSVQEMLLKHEAAGTTDSPEYEEAMLVLLSPARVPPRSVARVRRLGEIRVPMLVIGGRYDEATSAITKTVHRGIPGSEWVIFEHSSHMPHVEEPERYLEVLDRFLTRVETQA